MLTHTILGSWEDFQQEAIMRGDIEVHACLFSDHLITSIQCAVQNIINIYTGSINEFKIFCSYCQYCFTVVYAA